MQGDTLEPSTYFCWNCKRDFEIKHLLLFGMQTKKKLLKIKQSTYFCWVCKRTLENQAPAFCWVCKRTLENQAPTFCWGCKRTLENQAPTFCWVCKNSTTLWKSSTWLLLGTQKQHLKIKHLLLLGMQKKKNSWKSSTYFFCWVCQKHLKSTTTSGKLGYLFLQQLPKQTIIQHL